MKYLVIGISLILSVLSAFILGWKALLGVAMFSWADKIITYYFGRDK